MTICSYSPVRWDMCLYKEDSCQDRAVTKEKFIFEDVKVVNEIITGKVYNEDRTFETSLSGICAPFDDRQYVSRMSFYFSGMKDGKPLDVVLMGLGNQRVVDKENLDQPKFFGGFVVLAPRPNDPTPSAPTSQFPIKFDEGDTGTGTGMQAQSPTQAQ